LHELLLRRLRLPHLDEDEVVSRVAGDVVEQRWRPLTGPGRRIDLQDLRYLLEERQSVGFAELEDETVRA
jgi:hypothetical protein